MSDRTFRLIFEGKKGGLVKGSTPLSAAKKAYKKLSAELKKSTVKFELQETTKDSKKKVYGPYKGRLENDKIKVKMVGGGGSENKSLKYTNDEKSNLYTCYQTLRTLNKGYELKQVFYNKYHKLAEKILGKRDPDLHELKDFFNRNNPINNSGYDANNEKLPRS